MLHAARCTGLRVMGYVAPEASANIDAPYLGTDEQLQRLVDRSDTLALLGVGKVCVATNRLAIFDQLVRAGFKLPPLVSDRAVVHADVLLGDGTVIFDGAVVVTGSTLGRACIVNTNATVDHDCKLSDDVHVAPGATLSGGVTVGRRSMIGAGATVIQGVSICEDCLVGAGATVIEDIATPGIWVGTPARRVR